MNPTELGRYLAVMSEAAVAAGTRILEIYGGPFEVDYKGPGDPVTNADREANALLCERLALAYPDHCIVAEESEPEAYAQFRSTERVFFVDPLDGTREFVRRNGEFAVMLGLLVGERALAGVVFAPVAGVLWRGAVGLGAERVGPEGEKSAIRCTDTRELATSRLVVTRSHRSERLDRALAELDAGTVEAMGSAGLKGAHVAAGEFDAWLAPGHAGKRWDACACDALVHAAGGRFTDALGQSFDYRSADLGNVDGILAGNPFVHELIAQRLRRAAERSDGD